MFSIRLGQSVDLRLFNVIFNILINQCIIAVALNFDITVIILYEVNTTLMHGHTCLVHISDISDFIFQKLLTRWITIYYIENLNIMESEDFLLTGSYPILEIECNV